MGEAARKDAATEAAVKQLQETPPGAMQLDVKQACVMWAMQRCMSGLANEAGSLAQLGQKDAADVLLGAGDHLSRYLARFLADAQRSIVLPETKLVLP